MSFETPDFTEQRSDWEVTLVSALAAAGGFGGGAWLFSFRNGTYHGNSAYSGRAYDMLLAGGGVGLGVKVGLGTLLGNLIRLEHRPYKRLTSHSPFSAYDLGGGLGSTARLDTASAVIYKWCYISAYNTMGVLFNEQSIGGWSLGLPNAMAVAGTWQYVC